MSADLRDALRAEWTKARTLASTGWLLLAAVVLTVAVSTAVAAAVTCPASTHASTAMAPEASTSPVRMAALAASTVVRRGIAASVIRIRPVLYSLLIMSTARMATTAWPR